MFADRVNERGRKRERERERGLASFARSLRSTSVRNRVSGDGDLALSGGCCGKWPSNVTTNGHCWRADGWTEGRRGTKDGSQGGSAVQCGSGVARWWWWWWWWWWCLIFLSSGKCRQSGRHRVVQGEQGYLSYRLRECF